MFTFGHNDRAPYQSIPSLRNVIAYTVDVNIRSYHTLVADVYARWLIYQFRTEEGVCTLGHNDRTDPLANPSLHIFSAYISICQY